MRNKLYLPLLAIHSVFSLSSKATVNAHHMAMGCQDSSFIEPSISKQCIHQVMNADYAMSSRLVEYYIDKQSYHAFDLLNHVLSTKINPRDPS